MEKGKWKMETVGERARERERGRERERETYLLLKEVLRTFFFKRFRGPSSGGCEERESRGERKRKSEGERKEERKIWVCTNLTIIKIRIIMYI